MGRPPESRPGEETIRAWDLVGEVAVLASPQMEGRASGSPGATLAAELIANEFRKAGLLPGGEGSGYLQPFDLIANVRAGNTTRLSVIIPGTPPRESRVDFMGLDFNPFSLSADGEVEAELVFAGYGITAPELGYDDYAGVDVKGRAVLAFTHEPRERDPQGPFRASGAFHYATNRYKVMNAREHGATAIFLMLDPNNHLLEREPVYSLTGASSPVSGIVAFSLKSRVAEALLRQTGLRASKLQQEIDERLAPKSFLVPEAKIKAKVALIRQRGTTANVIGILPGRDPVLKEEAVVIGAHYDHLGWGGENSLAPDASTVHPGADDNASGIAALMALARAFVAAGGARRTLVFVAFSGEEIGLLGSNHYVKHPPVPIERTVAMINFDSVGRLRDQRLYVQGVGSGEGLGKIVKQASRGLGLELTLRDDGFGPFDHTAFYTEERPVLHFSTGPHLDYHRPSDTVDKINAEGLRVVTTVAYRTAAAIADRLAPIAYLRTRGSPPSEGGGERASGYGPYFGSIPDFSESKIPGVLLGGVRPGSPAEQAGLKAGDIIVNFAGVTVKNLEELTLALRTKRPGDLVEVIFLRAGKTQQAQATLQQRK